MSSQGRTADGTSFFFGESRFPSSVVRLDSIYRRESMSNVSDRSLFTMSSKSLVVTSSALWMYFVSLWMSRTTSRGQSVPNWAKFRMESGRSSLCIANTSTGYVCRKNNVKVSNNKNYVLYFPNRCNYTYNKYYVITNMYLTGPDCKISDFASYGPFNVYMHLECLTCLYE